MQVGNEQKQSKIELQEYNKLAEDHPTETQRDNDKDEIKLNMEIDAEDPEANLE